MKIKLEFQYFNDCPNHKKLFENLEKAIEGLEDLIELSKIDIENDEDAKKYKFRGSPTLLINGIDLENLPEPEEPVLACRFYPSGLPSVEIIRARILAEFMKSNNS